MSETIQIKSYKVLKSMLVIIYHPMLISMVMWISTRYSQVVFTSAYREGDSGVHGTNPCRGFDIRSYIYGDPQQVCNDINKHYIYDPDRPEKKCAIFHDTGKGKHIHLQVHPNTKYLGG